MEEAEVYDRLNGIFGEVFGDDSLKITPDLTAEDVDEWDSLAHIRLVTTVERSFHIRFSAAEIGALRNVGELVQLIRAKQ
jgi:acyl carrier protein